MNKYILVGIIIIIAISIAIIYNMTENFTPIEKTMLSDATISDYLQVLEQVNKDGLSLQYVSQKFMDNLKKSDNLKYRRLLYNAVTNNGLALQYIPSTIEDYFEIAAIAIQNNPEAINYVPENTSNYLDLLVFSRQVKHEP